MRAFDAGWGGAVWKTIGAPVLNVSNRYGAWHYGNQKMLAFNNVELISDRPLDVNLREIAEVKRAWPDRAVIASAMVESTPEAWHAGAICLRELGKTDLVDTVEAKAGKKSDSLAKHKLLFPALALRSGILEYMPLVPVYIRALRRAARRG